MPERHRQFDREIYAVLRKTKLQLPGDDSREKCLILR